MATTAGWAAGASKATGRRALAAELLLLLSFLSSPFCRSERTLEDRDEDSFSIFPLVRRRLVVSRPLLITWVLTLQRPPRLPGQACPSLRSERISPFLKAASSFRLFIFLQNYPPLQF